MNKIILAAGIAFALFSLTGFRGIDKNPDTLNHVIPKEKRALLNKIAGRWITQTNIFARNGQPASKVIGSDVWQWSPGGSFLVHNAYGIRDKSGFGALEITGYNAKTGGFESYIFNPDGSFEMGTLTIANNTWIWNSKGVRTTGVMDEEGKILNVKHEHTTDGKTYELFMETVLTKGSNF